MSGLKARSINIARDEKEDVVSTIKTDRIIFRLFLVALAIIPLIIGAKARLFISPAISGVGITSTNYQLDFFTFFKFSLLLLVMIITLLLFLYKVFFLNYKIKWSPPLYAIAIFIFALSLSVVFAEYKTIAMWGIYNRHDGALTFIAYAVLMFIALNITYPKKALNYLVYATYPFVWVNVIISLLNLYGINILENSVVHKLFTLFLMDEMSIGEGSILTGTLNQWNYMSGYSAVMAILFLTLAVFHGSIKSKIVNLLTAIAAFSTILASISTSGFVSLLLMLVLLLILILMKKNMKKSLVWLGSFILLATISTTVLAKHNPQVWTESFGFFTKKNPFVQVEETFKELGRIDNKVSAADPTLELPVLPERTMSGGSGRVYIWENMITLIKEKPITGYGLDTLIYHFPQNDINKRDGFMYETVLIDKPHNLFIGLLYGTGFLGLLSFLSIVVIYTFKLGKYVLKDQQSPKIWAFTLGWGAFLIQALLNDSVIGATIVPLLATAIIYAIANTQDGNEIS
ncbi:O-antigen ligase family protein [Psychrobacillus sp.]|uniref:O-antigen ligase family protein n=1 Tax=Psychrobacillus sp. TaxID=1871623 RepID=UPI0028BDFAB5|nr:O-antigen ligase family protein [Psychrobacillus sp.]